MYFIKSVSFSCEVSFLLKNKNVSTQRHPEEDATLTLFKEFDIGNFIKKGILCVCIYLDWYYKNIILIVSVLRRYSSCEF